MRIRALIYTTTKAPLTPLLDQAWDHDAAIQHPNDLDVALADLRAENATHRAEAVDITVPDDRVLSLLDRPVPEAPGDVEDSRPDPADA